MVAGAVEKRVAAATVVVATVVARAAEVEP